MITVIVNKENAIITGKLKYRPVFEMPSQNKQRRLGMGNDLSYGDARLETKTPDIFYMEKGKKRNFLLSRIFNRLIKRK